MSFNPILPNPTICYGGQVPNILKIAAQDTVLTVNKLDGGKTTFPVLSGTEIDIHVPGLHYNRTQSGFLYHGDKFSWSLVSAVLEGPSPVHARAVPWRLAKGRVSSIQSRYVFPTVTVRSKVTNTL